MNKMNQVDPSSQARDASGGDKWLLAGNGTW